MSDALIPYTLKSDDVVALILLGCFFVSAFILLHSKKYLLLQIKQMILHKERNSLFVSSITADVYNRLLLVLQTCVLTGMFFFCYFVLSVPVISGRSYLLLGLFIACVMLYMLSKWCLYSALGWVFLDKKTTVKWKDTYFSIIYYGGFLLLPFSFFFIYFNLSLDALVICGLILLIGVKILLFYKWIKFFFVKIYTLPLLILYFCALEIVPCLLLYRVLFNINRIVT